MWRFHKFTFLGALWLASFCLILTNASRLRSRTPYSAKDSDPVPSDWELLARALQDGRINMRIGLKSDFETLERHLYEVSDPYHQRYGRHLSAAEVADLLRPSTETENLVREWLFDHGIIDIAYSPARDWMSFQISIELAEVLLDTTYSIYQHAEAGLTAIRSSSWSLPQHLHDHIEAILPTNAFINTKRQSLCLQRRSDVASLGLGVNGAPSYEELLEVDHTEFGKMVIPDIKDMPKDPSPSQACNRVATSPLCLRTLYGTLGYVSQATGGRNRIGVVNFFDHHISNPQDTETFLQNYRADAAGGYEVHTENDPHFPSQPEDKVNQSASLEANLDLQVILGIAYPIPVTTYNVRGRAPVFQSSQFSIENTNEPYLEWLDHIHAQEELPQIISISYVDEEQTVPLWYAKRVCQGFAQLGARGVSVFVASGDEGVGADGKCFSNDGNNKPMFLPKFLASCPYVTTVGGARGWDPEIVGFDARATFVAGGGFSNYFSRPKYQRRVVDAYISSLDSLHDGLYNKEGRGYADISLRAYHYIVVSGNRSTIFDGTSASAPGTAAIFAHVNDALISEGRPALG